MGFGGVLGLGFVQRRVLVTMSLAMAAARLESYGWQLRLAAWPANQLKRQASVLHFCSALSPIRSRLCSRAVRETAVDEVCNDEEEDPFAELNIREIAGQVGGVRVRQHVNPLKARLIAPVAPPRWDEVFDNPALPLWVDIGCGSGRFLMMLARKSTETSNFLGLDVREKLVERSKLWAGELNLKNVYFMFANATLMLDAVLSNYPSTVTQISILCPDPHFKKKHRKRRIVQKSLVDAVVKHLAPGGQIFLQSDVREVAEDMRQQFDQLLGSSLSAAHDCDSSIEHQDGWLSENPFGIPSEREVYAVREGETMYRVLYRKL